MSNLENMLNRLVLYIVMAQIIICTILAILTKVWQTNNDFDNYLLVPEYSDSQYSIISFFTYLLLMNTLLPISLQVTLEVVKLV